MMMGSKSFASNAAPPEERGGLKMTERLEIYRCEICDNVVEMQHGGMGELICCGEEMKLYEANTVDAAVEKHVPVVEKAEGGVRVKVGSVPHPMTEEHYIEWVQVIEGERTCRKYLKPGDAPEAVLCGEGPNLTARAYCNLHGLWQA